MFRFKTLKFNIMFKIKISFIIKHLFCKDVLNVNILNNASIFYIFLHLLNPYPDSYVIEITYIIEAD